MIYVYLFLKSIYLSIYLYISIYLSIYLSRRGHGRDGVHRGWVQHERPGVRVPAVPGIWYTYILSIYLFIYLFLSIYISIYLHIYLSIYISIYLFIRRPPSRTRSSRGTTRRLRQSTTSSTRRPRQSTNLDHDDPVCQPARCSVILSGVTKSNMAVTKLCNFM